LFEEPPRAPAQQRGVVHVARLAWHAGQGPPQPFDELQVGFGLHIGTARVAAADVAAGQAPAHARPAHAADATMGCQPGPGGIVAAPGQRKALEATGGIESLPRKHIVGREAGQLEAQPPGQEGACREHGRELGLQRQRPALGVDAAHGEVEQRRLWMRHPRGMEGRHAAGFEQVVVADHPDPGLGAQLHAACPLRNQVLAAQVLCEAVVAQVQRRGMAGAEGCDVIGRRVVAHVDGEAAVGLRCQRGQRCVEVLRAPGGDDDGQWLRWHRAGGRGGGHAVSTCRKKQAWSPSSAALSARACCAQPAACARVKRSCAPSK
jgi:hypothetical protein